MAGYCWRIDLGEWKLCLKSQRFSGHDLAIGRRSSCDSALVIKHGWLNISAFFPMFSQVAFYSIHFYIVELGSHSPLFLVGFCPDSPSNVAHDFQVRQLLTVKNTPAMAAMAGWFESLRYFISLHPRSEEMTIAGVLGGPLGWWVNCGLVIEEDVRCGYITWWLLSDILLVMFCYILLLSIDINCNIQQLVI